MIHMGAEAERPARARPTTRAVTFWAKAEGKVKTVRTQDTKRTE
jgi:hypothetical protein